MGIWTRPSPEGLPVGTLTSSMGVFFSDPVNRDSLLVSEVRARLGDDPLNLKKNYNIPNSNYVYTCLEVAVSIHR